MYNFKKIATDSTSLCPLMSGREKLTTEDVISVDHLTAIAFDFAPKFDDNGKRIVDPDTGEVDEYAVLVFAEQPEKYYGAGAVLTKVCKAWATPFKTSEEASEALASEGGVKMRFTKGRTKGGRSLTNVEIL